MQQNVYFISDTHFGHKAMALKRGFSCVEEHDEHIIDMWNKTVHKKAVVYLLGDITMEKANYEILDRLLGFKKVVLGNHDLGKHVKFLLNHVNSASGMIKFKGFALTHCPIHPIEFSRFKGNIHGHRHERSIYDSRYFNVSCEALDYTPISFEEIKLKFK